MGKYMRKSKGTGVALMEVSQTHTQPSLGVRTRAKTLALQRLQTSSNSSSAAEGAGAGGSYLQLRSRRLEKVTPIVLDGKRHKLSQKDVNLQQNSSSSRLSVKGSEEEKKVEDEEKIKGCLASEKLEEEIKEDDKSCRGGGGDLEVEETSLGENVPEFDGRERTTRESTPCSLMKDPDAIRTPGSSTRPSTIVEPHYRENSVLCEFPTADEMEEFFSVAEELQQRKFVEKYNFDPVTDKPLPGRYEWEKLNQ